MNRIVRQKFHKVSCTLISTTLNVFADYTYFKQPWFGFQIKIIKKFAKIKIVVFPTQSNLKIGYQILSQIATSVKTDLQCFTSNERTIVFCFESNYNETTLSLLLYLLSEGDQDCKFIVTNLIKKYLQYFFFLSSHSEDNFKTFESLIQSKC